MPSFLNQVEEQLSALEDGGAVTTTFRQSLIRTLQRIKTLAETHLLLGSPILKLPSELLLYLLHKAAADSLRSMISLACTNSAFLSVYNLNKSALQRTVLQNAVGEGYLQFVVLALVFKRHRSIQTKEITLSQYIMRTVEGTVPLETPDIKRAIKAFDSILGFTHPHLATANIVYWILMASNASSFDKVRKKPASPFLAKAMMTLFGVQSLDVLGWSCVHPWSDNLIEIIEHCDSSLHCELIEAADFYDICLPFVVLRHALWNKKTTSNRVMYQWRSLEDRRAMDRDSEEDA